MAEIETFRDPALSLWQSAIHAAIARQQPDQAAALSSNHPLMQQANAVAKALDRTRPDALAALGAAILDPVASLATRLALALFARDQQLIADFTDRFQFGTHDPLWAEALIEYGKILAERQAIPYRTYKTLGDFVLPLPAKDPLIVGVIADWGTGTDEAKHLLADIADRRPDLLIHLGDIYYSGTMLETQQNFYALVRGQFPALPIFALAGNHEMYSGGAGYYALIDQLGQPASFFCLRNAHWQLLAMDTGRHDGDVLTVNTNLTYLEPAEAAWHQDKLATAGGRKTIALSHHQLFTAFADGVGRDAEGRSLAANPNLLAIFADPAKGMSLDEIALWLWGHEHNFAIFAPYLGLARGRCIGAGAVPVDVGSRPYAANPALVPPPGENDLPSPIAAAELASAGGFYDHCYAILTLSGAAAQADYYQTPLGGGAGTLVYSETIA